MFVLKKLLLWQLRSFSEKGSAKLVMAVESTSMERSVSGCLVVVSGLPPFIEVKQPRDEDTSAVTCSRPSKVKHICTRILALTTTD